MSDDRWQKMLDWRDQEESKLSPTSKALPRPPDPSRQLRRIRKAMDEDTESDMAEGREIFKNIRSIQDQLAPEPGNLQGNLEKIESKFASKAVSEKEKRLKLLREKQSRIDEQSRMEKATMDAFQQSVMVPATREMDAAAEYIGLTNSESYLDSIRPDAIIQKNEAMIEELNEYKQKAIEEYQRIKNSSEFNGSPEQLQSLDVILKKAEMYDKEIKSIMEQKIDSQFTGNATGFVGGRSASVRGNKRTKMKSRKALSANDRPRYDPSTLAPIPRQNESRQQFNRRMRRRRTVRTMPRRINRLIAERDLGDYPDEPGMYGGSSMKTRKKSMNSMKSRKALSANDRPRYDPSTLAPIPRQNESRQQFNRRMRRRRTVRTMPRRINRLIAERDLGDYPDEPGM